MTYFKTFFILLGIIISTTSALAFSEDADISLETKHSRLLGHALCLAKEANGCFGLPDKSMEAEYEQQIKKIDQLSTEITSKDINSEEGRILTAQIDQILEKMGAPFLRNTTGILTILDNIIEQKHPLAKAVATVNAEIRCEGIGIPEEDRTSEKEKGKQLLEEVLEGRITYDNSSSEAALLYFRYFPNTPFADYGIEFLKYKVQENQEDRRFSIAIAHEEAIQKFLEIAGRAKATS